MKSTTVSKFQAAMAAEVEAEAPSNLDIFVTDEDTVQDVADQIQRRAEDNGKSVDPAELSRAAAEVVAIRDEGAPSPLATLAENMARKRSTNPDSGDAFEGMELDVDPADAFGLVQANVNAWLEEHGRWATTIEIRHKADQLVKAAQNVRPGPVTATYTVGPDGLVADYEIGAAERELTATQLPGMPPEAPGGLKVPSDSLFGEGDFAESTTLSQRAKVLIDRHPDLLGHLDGLTVTYLWKKQGGKSKGRGTFGKCEKTSGLKKFFAQTTYVIWLAADHCRAVGYRDRELEALLFHEMLHTGVAEVDENTGRGGGAITVPHELEIFRAEVEIYGLWAVDLKEVGPAFRQVGLFDARSAGDALVKSSTYPDPITIENPLAGAGQLIHDDGTPLTADEIAEQEAAELRDDPAEFDDEDDAPSEPPIDRWTT